MAQYQYDLTLGNDKTTVVRSGGSSIGTASVRIIVDDVNAPSKIEVLKLLEIMVQVLIEETWPIS